MELANLALGVTLFAATNVDDLFVLLAFLSDSTFRVRQVVAGQYLGICPLIAASLLVSLIALALPPAYVGLLGLAPLAIGIRKLVSSATRIPMTDSPSTKPASLAPATSCQ